MYLVVPSSRNNNKINNSSSQLLIVFRCQVEVRVTRVSLFRGRDIGRETERDEEKNFNFFTLENYGFSSLQTNITVHTHLPQS